MIPSPYLKRRRQSGPRNHAHAVVQSAQEDVFAGPGPTPCWLLENDTSIWKEMVNLDLHPNYYVNKGLILITVSARINGTQGGKHLESRRTKASHWGTMCPSKSCCGCERIEMNNKLQSCPESLKPVRFLFQETIHQRALWLVASSLQIFPDNLLHGCIFPAALWSINGVNWHGSWSLLPSQVHLQHMCAYIWLYIYDIYDIYIISSVYSVRACVAAHIYCRTCLNASSMFTFTFMAHDPCW